MRMTLWTVVALAALAAAWMLARVGFREEPAPKVSPEAPARAPDPAPAPEAAREEPPKPRRLEGAPLEREGLVLPPAGEADALFSPALLAYAEAGFREGWKETRSDEPPPEIVAAAVQEFRRDVLRIPAIIGRNRAEALTKAEAAQRALAEADGAGLLRAAKEGNFKATEDFVAGERFDALFERRRQGAPIDAAALSRERGKKKEDGLTITFPPGVHEFDPRDLENGRDPYPSDVLIEGAGMDATLVRLTTDFSARTDVQRITIRNLTLDTNGRSAFDIRNPALVLALNRVRVVRFDVGAGGSVAFDSWNGMILLAADCELLAGYGRSPEHANLFRGRPTIARLSRCRIARTNLNLDEVGDRGFMLFVGCRFSEMAVDPTASPPARVAFRGCTVDEVLGREVVRALPRRDLAELFPELR